MRRAQRHPLLYAAVLATTLAGFANARVSWLHPGASHGPTSAGQPGWDLAFKSNVRINGGRGELETLGVQMPVAAAAQALRQAYVDRGGTAAAWSGGSAAWGIAATDDAVIRWLAVRTAAPRECLVFRLTQTAQDARASMLPAQRHQMEELPVPPDARPGMFLADDDQGWILEFSTVPGAPEDTSELMDSAMASRGWIAFTPRNAHAAPVLCGYRREGRTAWIQVSADPNGGVRLLRMIRRE